MKILFCFLILSSTLKYYSLETDEGYTIQENALEEITENELEDT